MPKQPDAIYAIMELSESAQTINAENIGDAQVARVGTWVHPIYGKFSITKKTLREIVENFNRHPQAPADYQHQSSSDEHDKAIASGWPQKLYLKNNDTELWATVEWTERAANYIRNKEYRYTSLEFNASGKDRETGNHIGAVMKAFALTNRPWIEGMNPVMLSDGIDAPKIYKQETEVDPTVEPEQSLNAPGDSVAKPPAVTPDSGGISMNEQVIRVVLGLAEGVAITEDHRNQCLVKLHEQNVQLTEDARVVAEGLGVKTLSEVPKMLSEGMLPGRFILTADRHAELLKAEIDLKIVQDVGETPVLTLGKVVLSESYFHGLEEKAEQGVQANVKLHEMTVDAFLSANVRKFTAAERPRLKERLLADFANVSEDIKARPEITAALFSVTSVGDQAGEGVNGEQVKAFIEKREAELLASGQSLNKSRAYSLACIEAKQKFTKEQYAEFEYPQKQAV